MFVGHINMWGDWAAHFTMGSAMGYRELLLGDSPFLLGARFSYPFAANFISAILIRVGVPFFSAFVIPSLIMSWALIFALYYFFKTLLSNKVLAVVAALLFLLNGGLGFYYFGQDIAASNEPLQTIINPPHEYTRLDSENIKWISIIDSMVIPQRAFNLGFPLTLLALALVYSAVFQKTEKPFWRLGIAGVILGLMPIIHTHSFMAAGIILSFWLGTSLWLPHPKQQIKKWAVLGGISLFFAIPLVGYFFWNQTQGFIKWHPGWLAKDFEMNWLVFWFKNWLVMPILGMIGFALLLKKSQPKKRWLVAGIWLPFLLLFVVANLFLFQPFAWDNTKVLVWAAVGIAGLSAVFLRLLFIHKNMIIRLLAVGLFVVSIASGTIDTYWIVRTDLHQYRMYTAEELELAAWVKENTNPEAVWLTGDQHNHWLFNLTGRQSVMTYRGWLWTHGYNYLPIERDVRQMYQEPAARELFQKYNVEYVLIGPHEKRELGATEDRMLESWQLIQSTQYYNIFQKNES